MGKLYTLDALRPLLPFEDGVGLVIATLDVYGDGLVKYAVNDDGFWLFIPPTEHQPLTEREFKGLTGRYRIGDLVRKKINDVYYYALPGGVPFLPLPFTANQFREFDVLHGGLFSSAMKRGHFTALPPGVLEVELKKGPPSKDSFAWEPTDRDYTEEWLAVLKESNPDAAELAGFLISGVEPPSDNVTAQDTEIHSSVGIPVQRFPLQDAAILNEIKALGLDPQAIPKNEPGKGGVKAQVRSALVGVSPLFPKAGKQFDHAWDRLRARKEVADQA